MKILQVNNVSNSDQNDRLDTRKISENHRHRRKKRNIGKYKDR